jgi:DNA-binding winged helix-turn-helix (wHTH) protein
VVPKALETLHVLLERRGSVVEKPELMKLVWPDTKVEEVGLGLP